MDLDESADATVVCEACTGNLDQVLRAATLANMEEVIYLYQPTREGDFLHELLKPFSGVLVSDFFGAYDSLPCKQQRCLIHLVRDFNTDILKNPYDDELKSLGSEFGQLLRQ